MASVLLLSGLAALPAIAASAVIYGGRRWGAGTRALRARIEAACTPLPQARYDAREIAPLPDPVQRYFRAVLADGQPMIRRARIRHAGQLNLGETRPRWRPFTSEQLSVSHRPGFDWDARVALAPGLSVYAHDAYVAGEGILHVELLGLATLADLRASPEAAQGELMHYLAEAAWYPTALLPSQGVRWEAVDADMARATLTDADTTVTLTFRFGADHLIAAAYADARPRMAAGQLVATPWQGRFWDYAMCAGMRVPMAGEVAWQLPAGPWPYWRGRVLAIDYDRAA